jgi:hypothetical protein
MCSEYFIVISRVKQSVLGGEGVEDDSGLMPHLVNGLAVSDGLLYLVILFTVALGLFSNICNLCSAHEVRGHILH